jgi:hypothetical protein
VSNTTDPEPRQKQLKIDDAYYRRLREYLHANNKESERGQVLVASSLIEEMLAEILSAHLLETRSTTKLFDGPNGALSTLSAKSHLARSLSLITSNEYSDIELVRKIRNRFAHNVLCSFEDDEIASWSSRLQVGMSALDGLPAGDKSRVTSPRQRFGMVSTSLVSSLYNRAHYVRLSRTEERDWPA